MTETNRKKRNLKSMQRLGFSKEELDEYAFRLAGYLKSRATTPSNVKRGMAFIIDDILSERAKKEKANSQRINFNNTKHIHLRKHGVLILKLHREEGYGATKIMKYLKTNHHAPIGKSTIERFLNQNKREQDG